MSDEFNENTVDISSASTDAVSDNVQPAAEQQKNVQNVESAAQSIPVKQNDEIAKLHRECAKYRTALNSSKEEKANLQKMFDDLQNELKSVTQLKKNQEITHKLELAGCLKPDLVLADIPQDCENLEEFVDLYKKNNPFLFKQTKIKHGFAFRGGKASNYTTSQQMNNYIRSALGR